MTHRFQQLIFQGLIYALLALQWLSQRVLWLVGHIARPVLWICKRAIWPPFVWAYKHLVLINERWKIFSHSSHRILSVVTHRVTVKAGVLLICAGIVTANVVVANQPRRGAGQFAQGTMVNRVVFRDVDIVVTAEQITKAQPQWWQDGSLIKEPLPTDAIIVEEETSIIENAVTGIALVPPSKIGKTAHTRTEIEEYIVQHGDTAGTIAAKFNLRMQTILDANDLDNPDVVSPGDTLKILPIDGVKHKWKKKDTLAKLAKRYKADIEDILEFNNIETLKDIEVGQVIIVPDGRIPVPKPEPLPVVAPTVTPSYTEVASTQAVTPTVYEPVYEPVEEAVHVDEAAAIAEVVPTQDASGNLIWPTTTDRISQGYGYGHTGIDVDGEFGDPTYATDNGTIVSAGWAGAYGNMVVVDHGNGLVTRYAHLQTLDVAPGQNVAQGQNLGEQGSTGNSSGSHLHYEVMENGQFVNPYEY